MIVYDKIDISELWIKIHITTINIINIIITLLQRYMSIYYIGKSVNILFK